jgi:hypothetical protein
VALNLVGTISTTTSLQWWMDRHKNSNKKWFPFPIESDGRGLVAVAQHNNTTAQQHN